MKKKKTSTKPKAIKRCGVFDREQARKDGKNAMDVLWKIANTAKADLSVTEYEIATYEASLQRVEQELNALLLPPGTQPVLPEDLFDRV
ncbi:MAG: hypothetical protein ABSB35_24400 [Bryobacteraceae bacterium]|jgi:hypothetical protein